jgi:predicted TIM-barrel fold metal-dependent hydrolase
MANLPRSFASSIRAAARGVFAISVVVLVAPWVFAADDGEPAPGYFTLLKIDAHSHVFEDMPQMAAMLRRNNVRTINICVPGTDGHLEDMHRIALELYHKDPKLFPWTTTFDLLRRDEPGYTKDVIAWLGQCFREGAVGVKIWKEVGMKLKKPDGSFLMPDDPLFDPSYTYLEQQKKPLHAHLAEPIDAWLPLDPDSAHYRYYSSNPQWHLYGKPGYPSHAAIIAARDHIMVKHPQLVLVGAHLGSLERDLDAIAERFDRFPNFYVDVAARTRNLVRLPSERVRAFFLKYPDRILYGVDASWKPFLGGQPTPLLREAHVKRTEERYRIDYEYYAGHGEMSYDGRKVEALALPLDVLEKFYHANAERVFNLETAWKK